MSSLGNLPYQRLTKAEKIAKYGSERDWAIANMQALDGESNGGYYSPRSSKYDMQINIDLANGILNPSDFEHIISEYRLNEKKSQASLKNYPIVTNILYALVGDKIARPFNFRAVQTNYGANSVYDDMKKNKTVEMVKNQIIDTLIQEGAVDPAQVEQDPDSVRTPEGVEKYMQYTWKDIREIMAQDSLNYLTYKLRLKHNFKKNFKNFLATGQATFYTGANNNDPSIRVVNPLNLDWDISPEEDRIEYAAWVKEEEWLTASAIYDRYYDDLSDEDIDKIEKLKGSQSNTANPSGTGVPIVYHDSKDNGFGTNSLNNISNTLVRVVHLEFASLRKIGILSYIDEFDNPQKETILDDTFKIPEGMDATIDWKWINEYWQITKIHNDIYINIKPLDNQKRDMDNLSRATNNYVGTRYDYCVVQLLKPHQYLYNVAMYNFEKAMALAKGKAILFDIAQIPTTNGFDLDKWLYYLNTANIAFINSAEETKRGDRASAHFNQFQVLDMSLANSIQYYITILDKIEAAAQELVGVTRQRLAAISSSELVGNTERAVNQSSLLTEHLYEEYEELERRTLESLLENAKVCWKNGKKGVYVLDSGEKALLNIDGAEFSDGNYGVFLSNGTKDKKIMNFIEMQASKAIDSGKSNLSAIVKLLNKDSITDAVRVLEADEAAARQQASQQMQQESELAKADMDFRKNLELAKLDNQLLIAQEKNIASIQVAQISAMSRQEDQDQDDDGLPDQFEIVKLDLERQKLSAQTIKDRMEFAIKKEKNEIDRIKANKPTGSSK